MRKIALIIATMIYVVNLNALEEVSIIETVLKTSVKEKALENGEYELLSKGLLNFLSEEDLQENQEILDKHIYKERNKYIKGYTIEDEKNEANIFTLKIKSNLEKLKLGMDLIDLGLIKKANKTKIGILVKDDIKMHNKITGKAYLEEQLNDAGYKLISVESNKKFYEMFVEDEKKALNRIQEKVDILILVELFIKESDDLEAYDVEVNSIEIGLDVRGVRALNGETLFSEILKTIKSNSKFSEESLLQGKEELLVLLGKGGELRGKKINSLSKLIAKEILKPEATEMILRNVDSKKYLKIVELLKSEKNIKNVFPKKIEKGEGKIEIEWAK